MCSDKLVSPHITDRQVFVLFYIHMYNDVSDPLYSSDRQPYGLKEALHASGHPPCMWLRRTVGKEAQRETEETNVREGNRQK